MGWPIFQVQPGSCSAMYDGNVVQIGDISRGKKWNVTKAFLTADFLKEI